jgi:hypothetical protein
MQSRKTVSIVLASIFFACAASFIAVLINLLQLSAFSFSILLNTANLNALVLLLLCIIVGIVLLACAGRKVRPVAVAVWGAGVLFFSLSFLYEVVTSFYNIIVNNSFGQQSIFSIIALVGIVLSLFAGIIVCVFAAALNRRLVNGTLKALPVKMQQAATDAPQPQDSLQMLASLKEAGLLTEEEYEQKRKDYLSKM